MGTFNNDTEPDSDSDSDSENITYLLSNDIREDRTFFRKPSYTGSFMTYPG